jgi:purine-cytosine permease-like protein
MTKFCNISHERRKFTVVVFTLLIPVFFLLCCDFFTLLRFFVNLKNQDGVNEMSTPWQAQAGINEEENSKMMMKVV